MCGRMTQTKKRLPANHRFAKQVNEAHPEPSYNITPGQQVGIILSEAPEKLQFVKWGLPMVLHNRHQLLANSRSDSLLEKPTYKPLLEHGQTCLVLADSFYEWKTLDKKNRIPYRFLLQDDDMFAMAGLFKRAVDKETGEEQTYFTIITTDANELTAGFHDRMPAILPKNAEMDWLKKQKDPEHYLEMLKPLSADLMQAYPVSKEVNNAANNYPELIERVAYPDQPEQMSLF